MTGRPSNPPAGEEQRDSPRLSVVIPAYREAPRLLGSLRKVSDYLEGQDYSSELIVVDDGSPDDTAAIAEAFMRERPELSMRLLKEVHRGKGGAVRAGVLAARGDYVLFSDADLSTPIEEVEKVIPLLEAGYDVVIGSRETAGARRYDEPYRRHFVGRAFNHLVRVVAVGEFQDTQCGFKAFSRRACETIFTRQRIERFSFDVEILYLARKHGYRIAEVPVKWYYADYSTMHVLRDGMHMFVDVLKVKINDLRGHYE